MYRITVVSSFVFVCFLISHDHSALGGTAAEPQVSQSSDQNIPATILMSGEMLAKTKMRIAKDDPELAPAMAKLIKMADAALGEGPYSVTDNEQIATGASKHDYSSFGRYWWPDPNKPDGLPYIRRDGKTNPDSQSPNKSDRPIIELMSVHTETLGLAYYLTGEEKYAVKAAELLRVWFLAPKTKMNPNLNFAQGRPGLSDGSRYGILDGRIMLRAFDGSLLIAGSSALSETEQTGLRDWAAKYSKWLQTSELAIGEASGKNNHGTFFDVQAMYFALYCGNKKEARRIAEEAVEKRVLSQIKPDGSMPEEAARTRPFFYSVFNLHAMFLLAQLAEQVDVQILDAGDSRLQTAADLLAPYTESSKAWPDHKIKESDRMKLFPVLLMANEAYPERNYLQSLKNLPRRKLQSRRENLAFPLME